MHLRKLQPKDAPLMLSWMHDEAVVGGMGEDFCKKTLEDAESFIRGSRDGRQDSHWAVASDGDEYMGTASLKGIDKDRKSAEAAIVVRREAMGRGYSWFGLQALLDKAFDEFRLESVYWPVARGDQRAVRFCDKHNFHEAADVPPDILKRHGSRSDLKWYAVLKGGNVENRTVVAGCEIVRIKTIPTADAGELSFFEGMRDIPFDVRRIYYISKVPEGVRRGFHAHKELRQLLFCPYGRIQLILENGRRREEIELRDPSTGVLIHRPTWREMLWLQKDSVLCVAASDYYKAEDYIRDYDEFQAYVKEQK